MHTATHVDAPFHFFSGAETVDNLPLKTLTGRAYVLHLPDVDKIDASVLERSEIPPRTRRLLFKTLKFFNDDKTRTAKALGISVKTIYNRLARYEHDDADTELTFGR